MDLILIRHAQPDWAPEEIARNDPDLTSLGREQAALLAAQAAGWEGVSELWVSSMRRARQTAEPIAAALALEPTVFPWLEEIRNPADWDGSPVDEIDDILRRGRLRPIDEMWDGLPGGESFRAFHQRVVAGLEESLAQRGVTRFETGHPHLWRVEEEDRRILLVAHGGTNAVMLGALLGLEPTPWEWERFASRHTSLAWLTTGEIAEGRAFSLRAFGDVGHLPPSMVTE
ncbi:MAG: histidine phosphatase family protein [Acidimicrobiia bacterium]